MVVRREARSAEAWTDQNDLAADGRPQSAHADARRLLSQARRYNFMTTVPQLVVKHDGKDSA